MDFQSGVSNPGRLLKPGEALVFSEENYGGEEWLVTENTSSLDPSLHPASIRIGPNTSVTIFAEDNYQGLSQDVPSDLPSLRKSKLKDQYPKSLEIWRKSSKQFAGFWVIEVTPGQYLSVHPDLTGAGLLGTSSTVSEREAFRITDHADEAEPGRRVVTLNVRSATFGQPPSTTQTHPLTIDDLAALTLVDEPEAGFRKFSLLMGKQWIYYDSGKNCFFTTGISKDRTIFSLSVKIAEDESQVGELIPGEAALYENPCYWGRAWVIYQDFADFGRVVDLNDEVSSIQLGPLTGATIYREVQFKTDDSKAGIQDIIDNLPSLAAEQVGENQISSITLWKIVPPADLGITIQCRLSQDFRGTNQKDQEQGGEIEKKDGGFEEYTAYRTTIRVPLVVETVEVWTTDETQIEVDNQKHFVNEFSPVKLKPNLFHSLIITTEALVSSNGAEPRASLSAPGLKIRTNTMLPHERIVIFPDKEVHARLANLKEDELWNATYTEKDGEHFIIKDRHPKKKTDVDNVQNMVKKVMSTVQYSSVANGGWNQTISPESLGGKTWALDFLTYRVRADTLNVRIRPGINQKVVGFLRRNEVIEVRGYNSDATWAHIRRASDGLMGWSSTAYIDKITEIPSNQMGAKYRVNADALKMRDGPGQEYHILGYLIKDEIVTDSGVMNEQRTWRKIVRSNGDIGWSSAGYLKLVEAPPLTIARGMAAMEIPAEPLGIPGLAAEASFHEVSEAETQAMLAQVNFHTTDLAQSLPEDIFNAVSKGVSFVVTKFKEGVALIVKLAEDLEGWIIDTAEKAVAFVEGIFERIGVAVNDIVNWLKYVFDWNDILATQKYFHDLILTSLDYLFDTFVKQVRGQVKSFFDSSKVAIDDILDRAITAMGCEPHRDTEKPSFISEVISSFESSGISDTMDWIVSKMMGGGSGGANLASTGKLNSQASASSGLVKFWDNAFVKGLQNIGEMPEDIAEIVITLVKNPDQPLKAVARLLEMIRDLLVGLIDIGEEVALGLLDIAGEFLEKVKILLTSDIRIPFISDIREWLGESAVTLGFSLLDVATLIVAIPITVVSKVLSLEVSLKNIPVMAQETQPEDLGKWLYTASYVSGAGSAMMNLPLDSLSSEEFAKYFPDDGRAEAFGLDERLMLEWWSWTCSLISFSSGLLADAALALTEPQADEGNSQSNIAETVLPYYEAFLLLLDWICLEYASGSKDKRARLRRHDDKLAFVASVLGLVHAILFILTINWDDFPDSSVTLADVVTTLPDVTAFLTALKQPPLQLISTIGMIAMCANAYPPIYKWSVEGPDQP